MCGIAGFLLSPGDRLDTARLTRALHVGIDPRGGDATGAAWARLDGVFEHHTVVGQASAFRSTLPNAASASRLAILHTRMATQGKRENHLNNHPVRSGHFLAVHNGHINNDDEIFATVPVPRLGEVDSEAAVALIRYANMKGEDVWRTLERLQGRAALAWVDDRDPKTLHLARGYGSPLTVAQTANGSVFFASTEAILLTALEELDIAPSFVTSPGEGTYMRFTQGRLAQVETFKVDSGATYWYSKSSKWTSAYALDDFERDVLGHPRKHGKGKGKGRKASPLAKSAAESAQTLALVPYSDALYQQAFSPRVHESKDAPLVGNDPNLWSDDWGWDNDDMIAVGSAAWRDTMCVMCGDYLDPEEDPALCLTCERETATVQARMAVRP